MLDHINEGFTLDFTQEYPHDSLKGYYGGYSMVIRRQIRRSSMSDTTRPLYTLLHVLIDGEVMETWGLCSVAEENALAAWWGTHHNHLSDTKEERRKLFKSLYQHRDFPHQGE